MDGYLPFMPTDRHAAILVAHQPPRAAIGGGGDYIKLVIHGCQDYEVAAARGEWTQLDRAMTGTGQMDFRLAKGQA